MVLPAAHGQHGACAGTMFLPQKPYMPLGSLRAQLCFPRLPSCESDDQLRSVQLPHPLSPVHWPYLLRVHRPYCACVVCGASAIGQRSRTELIPAVPFVVCCTLLQVLCAVKLDDLCERVGGLDAGPQNLGFLETCF